MEDRIPKETQIVRFVTDPASDVGKYVRLKGKFVLDNNGNKIPTIFSREVEYLQKKGYKIEGHLSTKK